VKLKRCRPLAAAIVLASLFVSCLLVPVGTSGTLEPGDLAGQDSRFIELLGLDIHYSFDPHMPEEGAQADIQAGPVSLSLVPGGVKPVILLLHGFGASSFS
jgi:hypothetical protein